MNNQDIVKEIIKKTDKESLAKAARVCRLWFEAVKTQIYTDFLTWAPAEILPDKLTYTKIDVKGEKTLVPKFGYTCKLEYDYNNNNVYIDFIIEQPNFRMHIMQKTNYDVIKAKYNIIDQIYKPVKRCEFCMSNDQISVYHDCNHRYFTNYEISYYDNPARLPLFIDKNTYTIIVLVNGNRYMFNHKQPVPVMEENATLAALMKFLFFLFLFLFILYNKYKK